METPSYEIHPKEERYFVISLIVSAFVYLLIGNSVVTLLSNPKLLTGVLPVLLYGIIIAVYFFIATGLLVGHIRGNGVRVTRNQFPDVYRICERQCNQLNIVMPPVYIIQSGSVLNAFATRFIGRNYVVIYSEIFDLAFEEGIDELSFVIAHELGHVKRNHIIKNLLTFPSMILPFLRPAYSRACEYTCDSIGHALSPSGSKSGLLILASGKKGYNKIDISEYLKNAEQDSSFWTWFAEKVSSHPHLPKRIQNLH
ncbi:MAG TPA: M48 family metallopeptidase [Chlorobaculum sp.]|nr:M48 family metallopeptidase [Chlorobaculum sp.]